MGSYYGGEQGCADDTGSVDVEVRGIPFYVLNNQRQEVLLSVTGEPVVLCTRLYEGTRCSCVLMDRESPESRCRKCFHPDTPVRTREGWLPICEVREGEEVLTGEGRFKRVTEVHRTHHHGPLVGLGTAATATLVWSTPEHPVLALGGDHQKTQAAPCGPRGNCNAYIKRGDGVHSFPGSVHQLPSGRWHARATFEGRRRALGTFDSQKEAESHVHSFRETHLEPGHRTEWKQAGSIHKGEWLAMGWPCEERDVDQLGVPLEFLGPNDGGRNGPSSFAVDQEFLWVLGMYIAEGCPGTREIVFALHAEETHFAERIEQFFGNKGYGYKRASTSENGIAVRVYSTTLSEWFPSLTGKGCANKRIPETLMALPPEKTWALIGGIHDGDGSKSCHEIGQTSRILSLQITELLHRLGEQPLTRIQQSNILTPNGNRRKPCYVNSWREDSQPVGGNRKGRWKVGDTQLARVTQVQEMDYCGPVYNLEVEEDHTYSAQGLVVHNCFGTGFVGGYVQFDNGRRSDGRIMVHFDPAADDLPQVEQGIDLKYAPNAWTMTVPPIQVRDFLIRFNVPLLGETKPIQEFRYEVVGITRNKTVLNLYGAQKMTLRRIQKTDPIYQWRAVYDTAPAPWIIETSLGGVPGPGGIPPHFHSITVPGPVLDVRTVNGTTTYVRQHNHPVLAGVVQEVLGHTHKLLEPHPLNPDCPPPDPDLCPDPL